ncbi:carboxymuconolactone decarboxylase family protein [Phreatobacter stygius]|nr:carboxymuconolactone decarboxylase family protein [Phreatobacter stygius]
MARLGHADRNTLSDEFQERFQTIERSNGYIPNSYMILAHRPPILKAFMDLSKAVIRDEGTLDRGFRFLVAYISSSTAGCQFCQAHNIQSAARWGIGEDRLNAIWDYEESDLFDQGEKAAFDLARAASIVPNAATDEIFGRLKQHYSTAQIVEIVAVISLFGWLNRFNDTLHTELDQHTLDWAATFGLSDKTPWDPSHHVAVEPAA